MQESLNKIIAMFKSFRIDPRLILAYTAQNCIGQKLSILAGNELGCMESVDRIFFKTFGCFIDGNKIKPEVSTIKGLYQLQNNDKFRQVKNPSMGTIIISPTVGKNIGHIGLVTSNNLIISNNSFNGRLDTKYTIDSWKEYYKDTKGLNVYYFDMI